MQNLINKVILGDCVEIMKQIPDNSIDLILTDPPYGIDYLSHWTKNHAKIKNDNFNDWLILIKKILPEFKRILVDTGCCCCCGGGGKRPVTAIFTVEAIKIFNLIQTLVWKKSIGLGYKYRPAYENIVVLSKSKNNYNFYDESKSCSNVFEGINQDIPTKKEHPTQKPVVLMSKLLKIHSKENDLILDPFAGSGTTGVACKLLNRNYILIEKEPKYFDMATKRLKKIPDNLF